MESPRFIKKAQQGQQEERGSNIHKILINLGDNKHVSALQELENANNISRTETPPSRASRLKDALRIGDDERKPRPVRVNEAVRDYNTAQQQVFSLRKNALCLPSEVADNLIELVRPIPRQAALARDQAVEGYGKHWTFIGETKRRKNRDVGQRKLERLTGVMTGVGEILSTWGQIKASCDQFNKKLLSLPKEMRADPQKMLVSLYNSAHQASLDAVGKYKSLVEKVDSAVPDESRPGKDEPTKPESILKQEPEENKGQQVESVDPGTSTSQTGSKKHEEVDLQNLKDTPGKIGEMEKELNTWVQSFAKLETAQKDLINQSGRHSQELEGWIAPVANSLAEKARSTLDNALKGSESSQGELEDITKAFKEMQQGLQQLRALYQFPGKLDAALGPVDSAPRELGQQLVQAAIIRTDHDFKRLLCAFHENGDINSPRVYFQQDCEWFQEKHAKAEEKRETLTNDTILAIREAHVLFDKWTRTQMRQSNEITKNITGEQVRRHKELLEVVQKNPNLQDARSSLIDSTIIIESMGNMTKQEIEAYIELLTVQNKYDDLIRIWGDKPLPTSCTYFQKSKDLFSQKMQTIKGALDKGQTEWSKRTGGARGETSLRIMSRETIPPEQQLQNEETNLSTEIQRYANRANNLIMQMEEELTNVAVSSIESARSRLANRQQNMYNKITEMVATQNGGKKEQKGTPEQSSQPGEIS